MITETVYFRDSLVSADIVENAQKLLEKVNSFLEEFSARYPAEIIRVSSGYRSPSHNAKIGGAKLSNHMSGNAVDISDYNRNLAKFCVAHVPLLEAYGLYCEDPRATPSWVHFQDVPPKSKQRFFIPSAEWASKLTKPLSIDTL